MCCTIESVVTIDERGQMVLPKDVRSRAGIEPGDKVAIVNCVRDGEICCIALMPAKNLDSAVSTILKPVLQNTEAD